MCFGCCCCRCWAGVLRGQFHATLLPDPLVLTQNAHLLRCSVVLCACVHLGLLHFEFVFGVAYLRQPPYVGNLCGGVSFVWVVDKEEQRLWLLCHSDEVSKFSRKIACHHASGRPCFSVFSPPQQLPSDAAVL